MKIKVVVSIMLLFLFGCATTNLTAVDQTGREVPMPHYVLRTLDGNYQVLFYWAKHKGVRDLDGTLISKPTYFDFFKHDKIYPEDVSKVTLTIEVVNPKKLRYELWERTIIKDKMGRNISRGGLLGYSNQRERTFVFDLPIDEELDYVDFSIDFVNEDGDPVVHIGDYVYDIVSSQNHKKGGESLSSKTFK